MIGLLLTVSVTRSRHLAARQVEAERARRNLSRHFSPHIAEQIAQMDDTLGQVRQLDAVVMFADLVGFTRLSDQQPPIETVAMLRDDHGCLARAVSGSRGTLDKYLGDGIMASFGTPDPGPHDASAALQAARTMLREMEVLNDRRREQGLPQLQLAIGLHYGPLTLGNIGDDSRVEYALIGETVNIAHRLEQMTRDLKAQVCFSQAFMDKLSAETRGDSGIVRDMVMLKGQAIRGLRDRMALWILPQAGLIEGIDNLPQQPTIH
jgi:adenylate cyclase